jgi:hypothetical protein
MQAQAHACAPTHTYALSHMTQKYVILIAFPLQQWFDKRPSISHYAYIASLV